MQDAASWLAVSRAPGIGSRTFIALLNRFGDPRKILDLPNSILLEFGLKPPALDYLRDPPWKVLHAEVEWYKTNKAHLVSLSHPSYPRLLRELPDAPPLLYIKGDLDLLSAAQLAIVGSRNPSRQGQQTTQEFSRYLAASGLVITSGLALGVDGAAHKGALEARMPTIAVMGTGLDRIYPRSHHTLAEQILESGGTLVTELPLNTEVRPENFPRRNRIISGLSLGTLVTEAALRSGSLLTARAALDQGREVFAIPGSIHNPLARGCHHLIRQGAKLVETGQDIIEELLPLVRELPAQNFGENPAASQPDSVELEPDDKILLEAMGFDPISVDQLVDLLGTSPQALSSMLLRLEMQGIVASESGGRYTKICN